MPVVSLDRLASLQGNAQGVRNICILAHVDHGKTSLTDSLIATNGIISPKMAGKIRYLDSRPDEQLRGITMESSAISLSFSMVRKSDANAQPEQKEHLINLIDSPGHVDFSSEVSTASRLCDGALVLVDAVEGVCSQTVTVLRQAWIERLKPLLVINKIDRLICELKMSTSEAYTHLSRLIEEVNAVLGSFFQGERMEEDLLWREKMEQRVFAAAGTDQSKMGRSAADGVEVNYKENKDLETDVTSESFEERDDESIYFAPENNNIIFSSAADGWAFTIRQFATLYEKKLGMKRSALEKVLWGDYYLDPKTKRVLGPKHLKGRALKPMFVQLVLENIWAVYNATTGGANSGGDPELLDRITKSLSLKIPPHILRSRDPRALMIAVFSSWLPLSTAVLVSVIEHIPPPPIAQSGRLPALIESSPGAPYISKAVRNALTTFTTSTEAPAIAYISKMVSVSAEDLPENKRQLGISLAPEEARELARRKRAEIAKAQAITEGADNAVVTGKLVSRSSAAESKGDSNESVAELEREPEQLIGFARLYSGQLSVGDSVYVLPPKFTPANPFAQPIPQRVKINALYLLMGRSLESLSTVPAGVVFGIGGLGSHILKTGTISTVLEGAVNLAGVAMGGQPIVRVALEPSNPSDLGKMVNGLKVLVQSDPCAQYEMLDSGEHVVVTAGELHLERCLKDLRERYARCDIHAGEPIVPFRESIVAMAGMAPPKTRDRPRGTAIAVSNSQNLSLRLRVRPLPTALTEFLNNHGGTIRQLYSKTRHTGNREDEESGKQDDFGGVEQPTTFDSGQLSLSQFQKALRAVIEEQDEDKEIWRKAVDHIVSFGPRRVGPNVLIDSTQPRICLSFFQENEKPESSIIAGKSGISITADLADRLVYAFQLATAQGPLCHEPIQGVAVFLEEVKLDGQGISGESGDPRSDHGRSIGEIIRIIREAIREGFMDWSPRIMLAMYSCEVQASAEVLGRVYGVITRRRGRILAEALSEGTSFFTITSILPVAESFGFSDEIRKRTSGGASPQLRFQGFELLDEDPLWVPFTEDELEDLGELADRENIAKKYMDTVRRRKGLLIKTTRTTEGEKARTLKK